jgi:hypothetical protein
MEDAARPDEAGLAADDARAPDAPDAPVDATAAPDAPVDAARPTDAPVDTAPPPVDARACDAAPGLCQGRCGMVTDSCGQTVTCPGCATGEACVAGVCKTQICKPNQPLCEKGAVVTCDATGTSLSSPHPCGPDATCVDGACVSWLFHEDFEDGDAVGWSMPSPSIYTTSIAAPGANGTGRSMLLTKIADTGYCCDGYSRSFSPPLRPKYIGFWVRAPQAGRNVGYLALGAEAGGGVAFFDFYKDWMILVASSSTPVPMVVYKVDQWYHIELRDIDWQSHTFDYYIDGARHASKLGMTSPNPDGITHIDLWNGAVAPGPPPAVYYDEIEMR